jgi:hypothetical protein
MLLENLLKVAIKSTKCIKHLKASIAFSKLLAKVNKY